MTNLPRRLLLAVAALSAAAAALGGLARLGLAVPAAHHAAEHGPLFVLGVFLTVISLERAVALGVPWAYAAPALSTLGAAALLGGIGGGAWSSVAATFVLTGVNVAIVRRQSGPSTRIMTLASLVLAAATCRWALAHPAYEIVPGWIAFFVLTILAERLELSRVAPAPPWAGKCLIAACAILAAASLAWSFGLAAAQVPFAVSLACLAAWGLAFDVARRTIAARGLPRFVAACVLVADVWLLVAAALLLRTPLAAAGPVYDAPLHAIFVGFVLSMVFAHAPIVFPAVARVALPFHPLLYVPVAALHAGLLVRVAGDLALSPGWRSAGATMNAVSLLLFAVCVALSRSLRRDAARNAGRTCRRRLVRPGPDAKGA